MIPSVFLIPPALGCLIAARCAAFYWEVSAELWSVVRALAASGGIGPVPMAARAPRQGPTTNLRNAEIVRFAPTER